MDRGLLIWAIAIAAYGLFLLWYNGFGRALTAEEVDAIVAAQIQGGASEAEVARMRDFLSDDDGGDFVMLNVIDLNDPPPIVGDMKPGETAQEAMGRYMAYMTPALTRRACHPVIGGQAAAEALDIWGIEGASKWTMGAMMRYRSKRDLLAIAGNPEFDGAHIYKNAAMKKTIAFPLDPWFQLGGGVRVIVDLSLALIASVLQGLLRRS